MICKDTSNPVDIETCITNQSVVADLKNTPKFTKETLFVIWKKEMINFLGSFDGYNHQILAYVICNYNKMKKFENKMGWA